MTTHKALSSLSSLWLKDLKLLFLTENIKLNGLRTKIKRKIHTCFAVYQFLKVLLAKNYKDKATRFFILVLRELLHKQITWAFTQTDEIPRFNLKLYLFVYDKLLEFPESDIAYDTITPNNFFKNVQRMHLHHLHVTDEFLD